MPSPRRTLIVGDGLAGALVAWELHHRGLAFEQWSDGGPAASDVAAGMFNPVSFRRILAQWNAKVQQEEAQTRFQQIEKELGIELWHRVPIVRIFPDEAYAELWNERAEGDHEVSEFLETLTSSDLHESVIAPFGAGRIPNAGWLDVPSFTRASRERWRSQGDWQLQSWKMADGCPDGFDAVIDCRGVGAANDLALFGLELRRNHGEVLNIQPSEDWGQETVNNVSWALPLPDGTYRVGSTYRWDVVEPVCLEETPAHVLEQVTRVRCQSDREPQIMQHQAGLRPSCFDRRPILGQVSPKHPYYFACTGWGTRGVSIGPTMVRWVVQALLGEISEVPSEVHPKRFRTFTEN